VIGGWWPATGISEVGLRGAPAAVARNCTGGRTPAGGGNISTAPNRSCRQFQAAGDRCGADRADCAARILTHPEQGDRLAEGEILVAPSTDVSWTLLFLRASAIVMETGGYLSHTAIVAREYGVPAVVNIPGLRTHVHGGEQLHVDGDTGEVFVSPSGIRP
jgi:phosphohistidine swiveling domain-containing protein